MSRLHSLQVHLAFSQKSSAIEAQKRLLGALESDYLLVFYRWQKPRSFMERAFGIEGSGTYYLRAVPREWTVTKNVEVGQPGGANETLHLPMPFQDGAYLGDKVVPGVLSRFQIEASGQSVVDGVTVAYVEHMSRGVVLGWDDKDYFVRNLQTPELQAFDAARPAKEIYNVASAQRIPRAHLCDVGEPEVEVFPSLPLGVYAAFSVPVGYSRIQTLVDDTEVDVIEQKSLLPSCVFSERPGNKESSAAAKAGLVLSRTSFLVDGVKVDVLVPLCQLETRSKL